MKYLIIISLLMAANSHAQEGQKLKDAEQQNKKRPSWSQGLPERQSSMKPSASMNNFKVSKQAVNTTADERTLEMAELPDVEIEMVTTEPMLELEIEQVRSAAFTRQQAVDQYYNSDTETDVRSDKIEVNPLIAEYTWTPIKTTPIDVTEDFNDHESLQLNIQINPKGEVIRVTTVANSEIPRKVFKNAEKSILKWRFKAPSKIGINENISKTFSIDIETDA